MFLPIEITEILINPIGPDQGSEYIVIENIGTDELSLDGLYLDDQDGESSPVSLTGHSIPALGELIIYPDLSFNNLYDEIRILDSFFNPIITIESTNAVEDSRYLLTKDGSYKWEYENFEISDLKKIKVDKTVEITEIMPNPEEEETEKEWIEIRNTGTETINLAGLLLDDCEDGSSPYELPDIQMAAGSYTIIYRSESKISLNNSDDSARILTPNGEVLSEVKYEKTEEGSSYQKVQIIDILTEEKTNKWIWSNDTEGSPNKIFFKIETQITEFDPITELLKTTNADFETTNLDLTDELKETTFQPETKITLLYEFLNGDNHIIDFTIQNESKETVIEIESTNEPLHKKLLPYLTTILAVILLAIYEKFTSKKQ